MIWLLGNLKLIGILAAVVGVFSAGWYVESRIAESRLKDALAAQEELLVKRCADDKKITEENSREYQDKVTDLAGKLAAVKRLRPARCIVPTAREARSGSGTTTTGEHAGQNGVSTDELYDYAGSCEKLRLQVIALQGFINTTWAAKGQ